jgi:hypothetical protein
MDDQQQSAVKEKKEALPFELGQQHFQRDRLKLASTGLLNPEWIEWYMGWPMGWTELVPLATGRFQSWRQQHGGF